MPFILGLLALFAMLFGGSSGGQNHHQNQPSQKTQTQSSQKASVANVTLDNSSATPSGQKITSVPTPALLPGLVGLGAAALRKRKTALLKPED